MKKEQLRSLYKEKRMNISAAEKDKLEDLILIQFQKIAFEIPEVIMTYFPFDKYNEFDPHLINRYCKFKNPSATIAYPLINEKNELCAMLGTNDTSFKVNKYGIEEPIDGEVISHKSIDMIFIPLLAFDKSGYRVGYGKGYYDRFLNKCREDALKVGFSFFEAENVIEDVNEYDVTMDICITPDNSYSFLK